MNLSLTSALSPRVSVGAGFEPAPTEICIDVKGSTKEQDGDLTSGETETADKYGDSYQVCIVYQVPEKPEMYVVANPCKAIKTVKIILPIKIPSSLWKSLKTI